MNFLKNKQEKGFLLIDALVGMLILTIALIAIVGAITSATKLSSANDELTQGNKLAQASMEKLKQVKASTWKELIPASTTTYHPLESPIDTIQLPSGSDDQKFTCTHFAKMANTNETGTHLVEVRVEVKWNSTLRTGETKQNLIILMGYCERQEDSLTI